MKKHTVHRLPDGAFAGGGARPLRSVQAPPPEPSGPRLVGEETPSQRRFRIPLTSTPVRAQPPADEGGS
jgi:hypothetical protein